MSVQKVFSLDINDRGKGVKGEVGVTPVDFTRSHSGVTGSVTVKLSVV